MATAFRLVLILCGSLFTFLPPEVVVAAKIVDTSESPFAQLQAIDFDQVRWTEGFWKERTDVCFKTSVPAMWHLMRDGTYKPFLKHFLIAAGKATGEYHGAKWNDGDFYKWLEAAIVTNALAPSEELSSAIDQSVEAICAAQRDDGYIHTPVLIAQRNGDLNAKPFQDRQAFETYNMGHLLTTACIHFRVTGKKELLEASEKAAHFLAVAFQNPTPELARNSICPSHYMGIVELYRTTGKKEYLELAKTFFAMRNLIVEGGDDNQDRIPFLQQSEAVGHVVRANYLYAGAADLYAETGDKQYLDILQTIWNNMAQKKMYITGGCGSLYDGASPDASPAQSSITRVHQAYGRNYQLPSITAHNETCANIANAMWCWRMFLLTGDAKYIDVLETALYNSILSGMSLKGTEFLYVNPLRVTDPLPTELRFPRARQPFFTSFCCPPNLLRTLAETGNCVYAKSANSLWINLFGSNHLETELAGGHLSLSVETAYPWQGKVSIEIQSAPQEAFDIKLRIPAWSKDCSLEINESPAELGQLQKGYAVIQRHWVAGDHLTLTVPMPARLVESNPLVEETANQVAIMRGPLVYCLESQDLPPGTDIDEVLVSSVSDFTPSMHPNMLGGVTTLEGTAQVRKTRPWQDSLYREVEAEEVSSTSVELIPYYAWGNRGAGEMSVWLNVNFN